MKIPKYQVIKNELKNAIVTGCLKNGQKFYTEAELINKYNVSSITVIRALNDLVKEGYLVRHQGKGTFISRSRKNKRVQFSDVELYPFNEEHVYVHEIIQENAPEILKTLQLNKNAHYIAIRRTRTVNDTPVIYHQSYLIKSLIDTSKPLVYYTSIYERLQQDRGIVMEDEPYEETNSIVYPAPLHISQMLNLTKGEPCAKQMRLTYSAATGKPLEYAVAYKRWDFYKFTIKGNEV